ncbi:dTDP-4-dehydrorhamnose reductase [Azonexus sp.]|uniref:dTDP-4-dehydrorhamnose reductase n=1 Tax=Azonexus sp. TaxID=1872668 RepID=UPI0035B25C3C
MKFLLTGKNGQVGFELQRALAPLGEVVAVDRSACDLADPDAIRALIAGLRPDVIVNPAAYTAVDRAESDETAAHAINAIAPGVIGEAARAIGAVVVHYSTDYVFDGTGEGAYRESDTPNPQSVYGRTKLAGEQALQASGADHLIFRTSWVFGAHGGNFAKTMLRLASERDVLKVVADQYGAPTPAALLADASAQVLGRLQREGRHGFPFGLYHLVADGVTTWHAYAQAVVSAAAAAGKPLKIAAADIEAIPTSAYPVPAPRPANSRLNTDQFRQAFGLRLPPWEEGLAHVLQQLL